MLPSAFFAAPISETVGRNPVYIATMLLFMVFVMASGLVGEWSWQILRDEFIKLTQLQAPNIGSQLTFRFFAGIFGATPLVVSLFVDKVR
jgi:MFS family permease